MPKTLSYVVRFLLILNVFLLFACGQKGALYLGENDTERSDVPIFVPKNDTDIVPNYLQLQPLTIGGTLAQIKQNHLPSWQALLAPSEEATDLIRYVVFDGDVLGKKTPLTVLSGSVQNKRIRAEAQRELSAGSYLRFRSLETGVQHLPALLASAQRYLDRHPEIRRAEKRVDFLTETEHNIDLYLAVEKR